MKYITKISTPKKGGGKYIFTLTELGVLKIEDWHNLSKHSKEARIDKAIMNMESHKQNFKNMETEYIEKLKKIEKNRKGKGTVFPTDGNGIITVTNSGSINYNLSGQAQHDASMYIQIAIRSLSDDIIAKAKEIEVDEYKDVTLKAKIEAANILSGETII